jgi:hypothetical protein
MLVDVVETPLPDATRALSRLPRVDYADAFRVSTQQATQRTAEGWARAMLEDAPAATRQRLRDGWRALGLRLGAVDDPTRVLGWPVRESAPDHAVLATTSRLGMHAELVFRREPGALHFSTLITLRDLPARLVWAGIARRHRRVVRHLLVQVSGAGDRA